MKTRRRSFFPKKMMAATAVVVLAAAFTGCNPFDEEDCPKLTGIARVGAYSIEKVPVEMVGLADFQFLSEKVGYARRNFRTIHRTDDGCLTWQPTAFTSFNFPLFEFVSVDTGFMVDAFFDEVKGGSALVFRKTTDGGQTSHMVGDTFPGNASQVLFTDGQTGWFTGSYNTIDPVSGFINWYNGLFSTKDGGLTWSLVPGVRPGYGSRSLYFVDKKIGFCQSENGTLYRTKDGGQTWDESNWAAELTWFMPYRFFDEKFGYLEQMPGFEPANQPVIFTDDGGDSWKAWPQPENARSILDFGPDGSGLVVANSTKCGKEGATGFFATQNSWVTFDETNPLDGVFGWQPLHFGDPKCFYVAINGEQLLKVRRE